MTGVSEHQRIVDRFREVNESNYIFACQAAVPLLLTPDLLYHLWNNFKQYQYIFDPNQFYRISHIAVSDLLLSGFCNEVGSDLFEIEKDVRDLLLVDLVLNLGDKRKNTIAAFLADYAQLEHRFTNRKNLKNIHLLTSQSILNPEEMEKQIIEHINKAETDAEKINYLLLHNNLMPVGYESDLSKISREAVNINDPRHLSPILIAEQNLDTPGGLNLHLNLPKVLRAKIKKVRISQTLGSTNQPFAQVLIDECIRFGLNCLDFTNAKISGDDFAEGGALNNALKQCTNITTLILGGQPELNHFPSAVFDLKNLHTVIIGGFEDAESSVTFLPSEIMQLVNLEILDLSYNCLIKLPPEVCLLRKLKTLKIKGNQLKTLPSEIGNLKDLVDLDISNNNIDTLPASLLFLKNLLKFSIMGNPVASQLTPQDFEKTPQGIVQSIFLKIPRWMPETEGEGLTEIPSTSRLNIETLNPKEPDNLTPWLESPETIDSAFRSFSQVSIAAEGTAEIPANRTLIAIQLTDQPPNTLGIIYNLQGMEDLFEFYKPQITYNLPDENGKTVREALIFTKLADFDIKNIVENLNVLSNIMTKRDQYRKIITQLKSNKLLKQVFGDKDLLDNLIMALQALRMEIQETEIPIESTTSSEIIESLDPVFNQTKPKNLLDQALEKLKPIGGFDFFENVVDGVQNLNPGRKARKQIFLEDLSKAEDRNNLKSTLTLWTSILTAPNDPDELIEICQQEWQKAELLLKSNLKSALEQTRKMEQSYNEMQLFFSNTEVKKVKNVSFINTSLQLLADEENTALINTISAEFERFNDSQDLRNNYSLFLIPGYVGPAKTIEKWAKIAHKYKVLLITDFDNLDTPRQVLESFESANLTGEDNYRSSVIMICNWLVGRKKHEEVNETEDLYISPAAALCGKIYNTYVSQVTAGRKFGAMHLINDVRFDLKKSEIAEIEKIGLIPMVKEFGKVMAFSAKTLFNGDNLGLQTYSVVRVFDYVTKVLIDFLNRRAFENYSSLAQSDLRKQIAKFLDSITGPSKLIEGYQIVRFERVPVTMGNLQNRSNIWTDLSESSKLRKNSPESFSEDAQVNKSRDESPELSDLFLDIQITPYFPAKTFLIKLAGNQKDSSNWTTEYLTIDDRRNTQIFIKEETPKSTDNTRNPGKQRFFS